MWVAPQVYEKENSRLVSILSYYREIMTKQCENYELYVNIFDCCQKRDDFAILIT